MGLFGYIPPIQRIINPALSTNLQLLNGSGFFTRFFPMLITVFFVIGAVIFIFVFLLGAIQWINSGGDKAQVQSARDRVMQAVIGIFILLSLFAFVNMLEIFFGTDLTYFSFNTIRL